MDKEIMESYRNLINEFCESRDERVLYRASLLSKELMRRKVDPDEIVGMHFEVLKSITEGLPPGEILHTYYIASEVLLELMMQYAAAYRKYIAVKEELYMRERKLNDFLELFISVLSHDLKNPLIPISGYAEILCEICEEGCEYSEKIMESANKMFDLIESARTFTKVRVADLKFSEVDIADVLDEVLIELEHIAHEKNIKIIRKYGRGYIVRASQFLNHAFMNIIDNAIKYSHPNSKVEISVTESGKSWKVCVRDWGEGVPDEWKQKIFERFVRGDKKGIKGSGFGLAIAKTVVLQNNGKIWVEDNPEGGAIFCVSLPKA
ncbi:MAG: ATP-binding protein [Canidatus Methanoxibalbensis ujae]|nr:ATP-binding protein [Candidatus Methanoxibalbensis ujae]